MTTREKIRKLQRATRFLYRRMDFGLFGGCGEISQILAKAAKRAGISGVRVEFGYLYLQEDPADNIAHAWLSIDGELFDPSHYQHQFKVDRYEPYDPGRPEVFQSDLLECLMGPPEELRPWVRQAAEIIEA